jgi:hypothetical protein
VDNTYNSGGTSYSSAGNNGFDRKGTITYSLKHHSVIAVGSVDQQNDRTSFSSVRRELEIMALEVDIKARIR